MFGPSIEAMLDIIAFVVVISKCDEITNKIWLAKYYSLIWLFKSQNYRTLWKGFFTVSQYEFNA